LPFPNLAPATLLERMNLALPTTLEAVGCVVAAKKEKEKNRLITALC